MSVQEQAVQMIHHLSDDNVRYLIDFMKRFMLPDKEEQMNRSEAGQICDADFMQELETMRIRAERYFPKEFDAGRIWEEAMDGKYSGTD